MWQGLEPFGLSRLFWFFGITRTARIALLARRAWLLPAGVKQRVLNDWETETL